MARLSSDGRHRARRPLAGAAIDAVAPWAGFVVVGAVGVALAVAGLVVQSIVSRRSRRLATEGESIVDDAELTPVSAA